MREVSTFNPRHGSIRSQGYHSPDLPAAGKAEDLQHYGRLTYDRGALEIINIGEGHGIRGMRPFGSLYQDSVRTIHSQSRHYRSKAQIIGEAVAIHLP